MTRKHFNAIAAIVKGLSGDGELTPNASRTLARRLAEYFVGENSLFNRVRFLDACRASNNPGCDSCGTHDAMPGMRFCEHCLPDVQAEAVAS